MKQENPTAKDKIYEAVLAMLAAGDDASQITTRQIAAKAGVNLALVNYYYRSKENLMSEVVGRMMAEIIGSITGSDAPGNGKDKIRNILLSTADAAMTNMNICKIAIQMELKRGCVSSCEMIKPHLLELFPGLGKDALDIVALQLMLPFHHIILDPALYGRLLNTDFFNKAKRDRTIVQMIGCVLDGVSCEKEG